MHDALRRDERSAAHTVLPRPPSAAGQHDDEELVARACGGDRDAFGALYARHVRAVHGVLLARVAAHDADDLVQDVFLAAWRGLDALRRREQPGAWLAGIARNLARRHHERAPRPAQPLPPELPDAAPADDAHGAAGRADELLASLRALPDAYRETLVLRLVEGLSGPEIARATGLTHGSVRVNLSRGMKLLRERLRREGWP